MLPKREITKLLEEKRYAELSGMSLSNRKILSVLISLTYDKKTIICWRAIEAIGLLTKEIAKTNPELVRNTIGRLLWMIRDESGGIGWSSPEILGEIVRNNHGLFSDIAPIIVSFLDEEKLRAGVLWAIGRIGGVEPELVKHSIPLVIPYLSDPDPILRGLALWSLTKMSASGGPEAVGALKKLKGDNNRVTIYDMGKLNEKAIAELA